MVAARDVASEDCLMLESRTQRTATLQLRRGLLGAAELHRHVDECDESIARGDRRFCEDSLAAAPGLGPTLCAPWARMARPTSRTGSSVRWAVAAIAACTALTSPHAAAQAGSEALQSVLSGPHDISYFPFLKTPTLTSAVNQKGLLVRLQC